MRVCKAFRVALLTCTCTAVLLLVLNLPWHPSSTSNLQQRRLINLNRRLDAEYGGQTVYSEDEGEFGDDDIVEDPNDDENDEDYSNPEFQENDFPLLHWDVPQSKVSFRFHSTDSLISVDGTPIVQSGIFWSPEIEAALPSGVKDDQVTNIMAQLRIQPVTHMEAPTWIRCGRPKNQFVTLADGSRACARYRHPHDYLIQGEIMSFYLARLLGIQNVPVVVLSQVESGNDQWRNANISEALDEAGWKEGSIVALIQWVEDLERHHMPQIVLNMLENNGTLNVHSNTLQQFSVPELWELMQWSDLVIFDYLTSNYDRVASMQDAADKEGKPAIMKDTVHNLVKAKSTNSIWLIDNEGGMVDGYALLYSGAENTANPGQRFFRFHQDMLHVFCIFRQTTVDGVGYLHSSKEPHKLLVDFILKYEPLFKKLPDVLKNKDFVMHFAQRIDQVWKWINECDKLAES